MDIAEAKNRLWWIKAAAETTLDREALDLAIEALKREIEYGQMVVDLTKGEKVDEWEYDGVAEKHQLSGETSIISEKESVEGDAESATTTDEDDCISRQTAIEALTGWETDPTDEEIVRTLKEIPSGEDMGEVSDGYHTFNQLYHQRAVLFATIVNQNKDKAWKSWKHEDGKFCFDKGGEWFIVGVDTPEGSYTYHYEQKYWDMFDCEELDRGKHWDGHTEEDVTRLLSLPPVEPKRLPQPHKCVVYRDGECMYPIEACSECPKHEGMRAVLAERPKGEWVSLFDGNEWFIHCSQCKTQHYEEDLLMGESELPDFCPNCGADMRGDKE